MKNVISIDYPFLKEFEDRIGGNVRVGGYNMNVICPLEQGHFFKLFIENYDINRVFLLGEATFKKLTLNQDYKLSELIDSAGELPRVKYWLDKKIDLSESDEWAPVFVSSNLETGSLITIDGNHRLMAHFLKHRNVDNLQAYLYVHPNITTWGFFPQNAS